MNTPLSPIYPYKTIFFRDALRRQKAPQSPLGLPEVCFFPSLLKCDSLFLEGVPPTPRISCPTLPEGAPSVQRSTYQENIKGGFTLNINPIYLIYLFLYFVSVFHIYIYIYIIHIYPICILYPIYLIYKIQL